MITRCEDTTPAKLLAALDRFITASHFRDTRSILQRIIDLLRSQPDVVMLRPADERGAELQPHVKALVYSLKPIANPRDVLRSPLSEISLSELILCCQAMATSMESRFRRGEPMRALKDDLDNLRTLSDALDLPDVTQSYHGVCSLLVEHVLGACQLARQNFVSGNYSETRHNFHRIDGFESMQEHCAVVDPDIRSREYVVVLKEINRKFGSCYQKISEVDTPPSVQKDLLDQMQGIDKFLKEFLDLKMRDKYRSAVHDVEAKFKISFQEAKRFISTADQFVPERLNSLFEHLQQLANFREHLEDRLY